MRAWRGARLQAVRFLSSPAGRPRCRPGPSGRVPPAQMVREFIMNSDGVPCTACGDLVHSVWWVHYGSTGREWVGGGGLRANGIRIDGGNNSHKREKKKKQYVQWNPKSEAGREALPPTTSFDFTLEAANLPPGSLTTLSQLLALDSWPGGPAERQAFSDIDDVLSVATGSTAPWRPTTSRGSGVIAATAVPVPPPAAIATSDAQAEPTVTVTDGEFVSSLLQWTRNDDLSQKVAEALKQLGFETRQHLEQLLGYNEERLREVLKQPEVDPALTFAAKDAFVSLVLKAKERATDDNRLVEHFIEEVLKGALSQKLKGEQSDADVCEGAPIHEYIDFLRAESVKPFTVDSVKRVGFSIRLDSALPDDEGEKDLLLQKLQAALAKLLRGATIRKLTHGSIIVTCDWWPEGGAWALPPAVHQFLSEPSNEFSGFRLLPFQSSNEFSGFRFQSSSLRYEDYELQLRAVEQPLAIQLGHKKQKTASLPAQLELGGEPSRGEPSCADGSSCATPCSRSHIQVGARAEARQQEAAVAHELRMPGAHKELAQLEELLSHERRRGDARTTQATQRLMQMRLAQVALMPDPHYLDKPPLGMMQLCHRESVVQFINEVRCPRPPAPSCPLCPTPHPRLVLPAPGM